MTAAVTPHRAGASGPSAPSNPLEGFGYGLMLLYMFFCYSRVLDVSLPFLHLPLIIGTLLYVMVLASGGFARGIGHPQGRYLLWLTLLMVFSAAFGVWRGSSYMLLKDLWFKSFPFFFIVVSFTTSPARCFGLLRCLAFAITVLSAVAIGRGETDMGRLIISGGSRFGNPNDLASICLLGFPLWMLQIQLTRKMLLKIMGVVAMGIIMFAVLKTGSRGAFVGLIAGVAYVFFRSSLVQRFVLVLSAFALIGIATVTLPPSVLLRYMSMFVDVAETENASGFQREMSAAEGSSESRTELLRRAIILGLKNPLLGVGPGNYAVAEDAYARSLGMRKGIWHVTHNMYADILSEVGIPALFVYVSIIVVSFRQLRLLTRLPASGTTMFFYKSGYWLTMAFICFCVAAFFQSVAYHDTLPMLAGVTASLTYAARQRGVLDVKSQPAPAVGRMSIPARPMGQLSPTRTVPAEVSPRFGDARRNRPE